ncbi:MAG: hypothetical protein ABI720_03535 [Actinomycetes bacterium]
MGIRTSVPFGLAAGTLYFIVIAALSIFTAVLDGQALSLFGLVLFIGVGAGLGLVLGVVTGLSVAAVAGRGRTPTARRILGGLAAGLPVLAITTWEYLTDTIGILDADVTTVIAVPTLVATVGGAAMTGRFAPED